MACMSACLLLAVVALAAVGAATEGASAQAEHAEASELKQSVLDLVECSHEFAAGVQVNGRCAARVALLLLVSCSISLLYCFDIASLRLHVARSSIQEGGWVPPKLHSKGGDIIQCGFAPSLLYPCSFEFYVALSCYVLQ